MGQSLDFACPSGARAAGYLASAEKPKAGIVVLQEWWGLNNQICGIADRLAADGYVALVPDLYRGRITNDADEANHLMTRLDWINATENEIAGALRYLKGVVPKVAVLGFCMGGALSIIVGVRLPSCDAVVSFYGIPPAAQANPAAMNAPFIGHFANRDKWYPPAAVDALAAALAQSSAPHEIHRYDVAHAFCNEKTAAYDAAASELAWSRTSAFFRTHL